MTTVNFITDLFCRADDALGDVPHHPQAHMSPSEVVSLSLLFVLEGGRERTFYRWLERDDRPQFLRLPACTRLFRLFGTHHGWTDRILVGDAEIPAYPRHPLLLRGCSARVN